MKFRKIQIWFLIMTILSVLFFEGCNQRENKLQIKEKTKEKIRIAEDKLNYFPIQKSLRHKPNFIICDLDGDMKQDSVIIVRNTKNHKYGFKIVFANKQVDFLGMGIKIAGQDFDDIEWAGIFYKISKGESYANNVDEEGNIIAADQIKEEDLIVLPNDGIYIHQSETCGGGIIYLKGGQYKWIQQE